MNLLEFATGQDPNASTRVVSSLVKTATGLEFTYTRSKAAVQDGVTYSVEYSDLLTPPWTSVGPGTVIADNGTLETVRATNPRWSGRKSLPPPQGLQTMISRFLFPLRLPAGIASALSSGQCADGHRADGEIL